ncbi:MAG: cytochrome c [Pseudomonadales bacterium]
MTDRSIVSRPALRSAALALTCTLSLLAAPLSAAPSPADRAAYAVESRQSVLHLMGFYIGPLAGMARGQLPIDLTVIANNAGRIAELAPMIPETFALNTSSFELETEALPVIWDKQDDFNAKASALQEKAQALATLAAAGSEDGIPAAIGAMGQTCGSCHDDFRVDDE